MTQLGMLRAQALDDTEDIDGVLEALGTSCDKAEAEIAAPGAFTDVASLAGTAANGRLRRGDYFEMRGDAHGAARERHAASILIEQHGTRDAQIEVRRSLANSLKYQARYGEALTALAQLESTVDPDAEPINHARIVLDQARLLEWLRDFERADAALSRAEAAVGDRLELTPLRQGKWATLFGALLDLDGAEETMQLQGLRMDLGSTRGLIAMGLERYDEARQHFRRIRQECVQSGIGPSIDYQLMRIDALDGRGQTALARLNALDASMRADARLVAKLPVLHWVAATAVMERDPTWALDRIEAGIPTLEHVADYEVLWKLYRSAAHVLQRLGRDDEATVRFLDSARTVDHMRRVPLGYRLESTYFADRAPLFAEAIAHVAQAGDAHAALELSELAKSRSLATLVYGGRRALADDPHAQRITELSRKIDASDLRSFDGERSLPGERDRLVQERATAIEQIRVSDPRWRGVTEPPAVSADAVVEALGGAVGISLFVEGRAIIAVTVDESGVTVDRTSIANDVWQELDAYATNVRRAEDPYAYDLSGFGEVGLRDLLPASTVSRLFAHDRAVVSPHGLLHLVPWSTLLVDDERLFQRVGVTTLPNLMCLPALAGPWTSDPAAIVIGAPDYEQASGLAAVDSDGAEYLSVCKVWAGARGGSLLGGSVGRESTESVLHRALGSAADLLHVSCHGVIDHSEPSASALIAADGKVDAAEIALSGTCPDEVVLAACSTGYRPNAVGSLVLSGDDVVGLPAAFLEAGARSILMSIPKAHEQTSVQFMTRYHAARADGSSPVDAYRSTQIAMLDVADPALWCGYAMYGSPTRTKQ